MKATRAALSNLATTVYFENMDDFGSVNVDPQTLDEMQIALDIKRACATGVKRIIIDITEDKRK